MGEGVVYSVTAWLPKTAGEGVMCLPKTRNQSGGVCNTDSKAGVLYTVICGSPPPSNPHHPSRSSLWVPPLRYHDTQKRFPHLANCLKYSMAFTVALFGVFSPPNSTTTAVKVRILAFVLLSL